MGRHLRRHLVALATLGLSGACQDTPPPAREPAPRGALCERDTECGSALCVQGVCCDRRCDSGCEACNVVGAAGTCLATPGPALQGACDTGAVCSADARCAAAHHWSRLSASTGSDEITAAAPGPSEGLLVGGRFTTELAFGAEPALVSDADHASGFLALLDELGEPRWALTVGEGATVEAVASRGELFYAAGTLTGAATLFGEAHQADVVDGYVAALDEQGVRWLWLFDGEGTQRVDRLTALPDGGVAVGARHDDPNTLSAVVIALDAAGEPRWSIPIASEGNDRVGAIAVDDDGGLAITGSINGPVTLGATTLEHRGAEDVIVVRLSADGAVTQAQSFGGAGSDVGQAVVPAPDGGLFVAGFFTKGIDFGNDPMLSAGCEDLFLVRLDSQGQAEFSRRFGDAEPEVFTNLAITPEGTLVAAGDFEGELDFGWGPLTGRGELDIWVASWDLDDGEPIWATSFGGALRERVHAFIVTSGGLVVAGRAQGELDFGGPALAPVGGADAFVAALGR